MAETETLAGKAAGHRLQMDAMQLAAPALGMVLQSLPTRNVDEIDAALRAAWEANTQAIVTMDDPFIQSNRVRIVEFAMRQRLPVMGEFHFARYPEAYWEEEILKMKAGGVQVKAADLLGMSFRSFRYYVKKYNLR